MDFKRMMSFFAVAMLITVLVGIWILSRKLEALEYQTFMLQ